MKRTLLDFKPPKPHAALIALCRLLFPNYLRMVARLSLRFSHGSNELLKFMKDRPVVFFMNHPDRQDPLAIIALAEYLREPLYCVVAREVFDWNYGARGWLFQRLGCYSVNRGIIDVRSIRTTSKILTEGRHKLLVFPEAMITGDNDSVHEIQSSFVHILLDVQAEMASKDPSNSIYVIPVAVRYELDTDLESSLGKILNTVEKKINIEYDSRPDIATRTTTAAQSVLKLLALEYGYTLSGHKTLCELSSDLVTHICSRMSAYVGVNPNKFDSQRHWLHHLRHAIAKHIDKPQKGGGYQLKLKRNSDKIYRQFLCDLDRIERLLILERITSHELTPIQMCRIVDFLECETTGQMSHKGHQSASIHLGEPIDVLSYVDLYKSSKNFAIQKLTTRSHRVLQSALDGMKQRAPTLAGEAEPQSQVS